jgi:hypothetical protein
MSSRTTRELVGYAPDGTKISLTTSGGYEYAGITKNTSGTWAVREKGSSLAAVQKRTQTAYARTVSLDWAVAMLFEQTAPVVAEYFGHHAVIICGYWIPGQPEQTGRHLAATRKNIRELAARGATQISFRQLPASTLTGRDVGAGVRGMWAADFQAGELLSSMKVRRPTVQMCTTIGHSQIPASHRIHYRYRNEIPISTEYTCPQCTESYSRRPVLVDFTAEELHKEKVK